MWEPFDQGRWELSSRCQIEGASAGAAGAILLAGGGSEGGRSLPSTPPGDHMAEIQFQVYGINLLVRLLADAPAEVRVHCPKGSPIRYGEVVGRGDGFDEGANAFRDMPPIRAVVAFEENPEEVEGHYFYISGEEHRVIRLDAVILSFPLE